MNRGIALLFFLILAICPLVRAATLKLHDGTVLQGRVIKTADGYWIKASDGTARNVDQADVESYEPDAQSASAQLSDDPDETAFAVVSHKCESIDKPASAVTLWKQFIDKHPQSTHISQAKAELTRWNQLASGEAERIHGQWVGGEQRRQIIEQADALTREAIEMIRSHQSLAAVDKLKASERLYPNSFMTQFFLGYVSIFKRDYDAAAVYFTIACHLKPDSYEALNNLAVSDMYRHRIEQALDEFMQAAQLSDSRRLARNLVTALSVTPTNIRNEPRFKAVKEAANLLSSKYNVTGPTAHNDLYLLAPLIGIDRSNSTPGSKSLISSFAWSGTGFFISDDGLILTNRHVAAGGAHLLVLTQKDQLPAEVVAIDTKYDLALIKISSPKKVPFVTLNPADVPNEGADCLVMGFPMIDSLGADIKITRGIVSSASQDQEGGADVLTDAKVNPGNSGGPILDHFGNCIAIVCMKSYSSEEIESYGIGISAGHIREFLARNHVSLPPPGVQGDPLTTEALVQKIKPATVCILAKN